MREKRWRSAGRPPTVLPKYHLEWRQIALANSATTIWNMTAGLQRGAIMRSYFMIVAWAIFTTFVATHIVSTQDQMVVAAGCVIGCSNQPAEADNGLGVPPPIDPNDDDDDDDN
jgi:hypothetical protein